MTIYSCKPRWEDMLTCIYVAWASKKGHKNIRLQLEPLEQYNLFDEYIHVDPDLGKAQSVMSAVKTKISPYVYRELAFCSMAYEEDTLDILYHVMILGFSYGPNILDMVHFRDVMRFREICTRVSKEAHHFREFLRFHELPGHLYIAHLEPKSRICVALGPSFQDRMPSENWIIVDDVHLEAVIHPKDEPFYLKTLTDEELSHLLQSEKENDDFTDLWRVFFNSISIKERENYRCQRNLFPLWKRSHAVEFLP